jgi:hypothetical protein
VKCDTTTTEYNCGIDLHARQMYACLMDRQGKVLLHTNIQGNDFEYFLKRVESCRHDLTVVRAWRCLSAIRSRPKVSRRAKGVRQAILVPR